MLSCTANHFRFLPCTPYIVMVLTSYLLLLIFVTCPGKYSLIYSTISYDLLTAILCKDRKVVLPEVDFELSFSLKYF